MTEPNYQSLHDYLEQSGVLNRGDAAEIEVAKKEYRKWYLREYKRARRGNKQELVISIPKGYYQKLHKEAARHGLSASRLVFGIVDAYLRQKPVIHHPDRFGEMMMQVAQLHSELQFIGDQMIHELVAPQIQALMAKVERIEEMVKEASYGGEWGKIKS